MMYSPTPSKIRMDQDCRSLLDDSKIIYLMEKQIFCILDVQIRLCETDNLGISTISVGL